MKAMYQVIRDNVSAIVVVPISGDFTAAKNLEIYYNLKTTAHVSLIGLYPEVAIATDWRAATELITKW